MWRLSIFADDLTGAADTAAMFVEHGCDVVVAFGTGLEECKINSGVTAYSLATRDISPQGVAQQWSRLPETAISERFAYLKVDSTLRGNVGASIRCFAKLLQVDAVLLCPAFPQQRRQVAGDSLLLDGQKICSITALLAAQGCTTSLTVADPKECQGLLTTLRRQATVDDPIVLVGSAMTVRELEAWATFLADPGVRIASAGSAGLAGALANLTANQPVNIASSSPKVARGRTIAIIGSRTNLSKRQCDRLAARHDVRVVRGLPQRADDWLLHDELHRPHLLWMTPSTEELNRIALPAAPSFNLRPQFTTLILSGGDTAEQQLLACGCNCMTIQGQLQPGIPVGSIETNRIWSVILKSGGFGDDDALTRVIDRVGI